jgi:hypothetical protein
MDVDRAEFDRVRRRRERAFACLRRGRGEQADCDQDAWQQGEPSGHARLRSDH